MEAPTEEIRVILKFYFHKGKNASQAREKICEVYGDDALKTRIAQKWFARFRSGNFDVKDAPRSGRPITARVDEILEKIGQNPHATTREIAAELNIDHKTVLYHLRAAGFVKKLDK